MSEFVNFSEEQDVKTNKDQLNNIDDNQETELQSVKIDDNEDDEAYDYDNQIYRRNWGKNIVLKFDPATNEPKYTIGPHWPLFMVAFLFLSGCGIYMLIKICSTESLWQILLCILINFGEMTTYLRVAIKNPGIVSSKFPFKYMHKVQDKRTYCHVCQIIRRQSVYHCYDCDVCVSGYDHHCPWTGKCIGGGNLSAFYMFLANTLVFMVYNIIMALNLAQKQRNYRHNHH